MLRRLYPMLVATTLAACAGPRADVPVAAKVQPLPTWRAQLVTSEVSIQRNWWLAFGDPVLSALVEQALEHNDDIALAVANVQEARAQLHFARSQGLPSVSLALDGARQRSVNPGFGVPDEQTAGEALLQASFDLDMFGRIKAGSNAARALLLATENAQQTVRLSIAATTANAYFTLLALDARLVIVRQTVGIRTDELGIEQQRFAAGYSPALDLTRAQAELESAAQLVPMLELSIAKVENGLSILLSKAPGPMARTSGNGFGELRLPEVPLSLPSGLLRNRPDIATAEARLAASDYELDAARAAFMPDVRLAASGGYVGSTLVVASPVAVWSFGTSILAPLFDSGRLKAQQDAATARRDAAAFAYRKTVLQAFREVENDLTANVKYREQTESLARQCEALKRSATMATRRYREGYVSYLDQLDAQRNLLTAELSLLQSRLDQLNATVSLISALGGGWMTAVPQI